MRAHAHDLRAEVRDFGIEEGEAADRFVEQVAADWKTAGLGPRDRALCEYAELLTTSPASASPAAILALREAGLDDRAIHDAAQVISYFNYINRLADGLGVDEETGVRAWDHSAEG
jgi:uncharacterized peroxidase-related enzyme